MSSGPETAPGFHGGIQLPLYLNANYLFLRTSRVPEPGHPREQLFHFVIKIAQLTFSWSILMFKATINSKLQLE